MGWLESRRERKRLEAEELAQKQAEARAEEARTRSERFAAWEAAGSGNFYSPNQLDAAAAIMNELQRDPAMLMLLGSFTEVMSDTNRVWGRSTWAFEDGNRTKRLMAVGQTIHFNFGPLLSPEGTASWRSSPSFQNLNLQAGRGAPASLSWRQVVAMLTAHSLCNEDLRTNDTSTWTRESVAALNYAVSEEIALTPSSDLQQVGEAEIRECITHLVMTAGISPWLQEDPRINRLHQATMDEAMHLALFG